MKEYIGTKRVLAEPMTRQAYNDYRGMLLPANEVGTDEGYLVEYLNGGKPNHPNHPGYISWSPKQQFDDAHEEVLNGMTIVQRAENMIQSKHFFSGKDGVMGSVVEPGEYTPTIDPRLKMVTFCVMVLKNGYLIVGEASCANPDNYCYETGKSCAEEAAFDKVVAMQAFVDMSNDCV